MKLVPFVFLILTLFTGCYYSGEEYVMSETGAYTGWSASRELISKDTNPAVQLQANFQDPTPYTVQFSITNLKATDGSADIGSYNPTAVIEWSVEGNSVRRVVSVINGTSVTGVGQGCRITVRDQTPTTDTTKEMEYTVAILVAPGVRPANQLQPILTPLIADSFGVTRPGAIFVDGGTGVDVQIPENAGVTSVYITAASLNAGIPVALTDADIQASHTNTAYVYKEYNPNKYTWVPIGPGTSTVRLTNFMGPLTQVLFNVTFGIDG
jgi:hypothetical protein